jgi:hypothetical protein
MIVGKSEIEEDIARYVLFAISHIYWNNNIITITINMNITKFKVLLKPNGASI